MQALDDPDARGLAVQCFIHVDPVALFVRTDIQQKKKPETAVSRKIVSSVTSFVVLQIRYRLLPRLDCGKQ